MNVHLCAHICIYKHLCLRSFGDSTDTYRYICVYIYTYTPKDLENCCAATLKTIYTHYISFYTRILYILIDFVLHSFFIIT